MAPSWDTAATGLYNVDWLYNTAPMWSGKRGSWILLGRARLMHWKSDLEEPTWKLEQLHVPVCNMQITAGNLGDTIAQVVCNSRLARDLMGSGHVNFEQTRKSEPFSFFKNPDSF